MHFAEPAWLLLLVLIPILGTGAVLVARLRRRQWHVFVADRLRPVLLRATSPLARWVSLIFLLAASIALIVAMARPQGDAGVQSEKTKGRNILIALDLSRSMRVADVTPDRLAQAKIVIYELLEALPNERIGLIGFGGTAHLLAPLTIDHGAVRETVEQADETWVELGGSNFAGALKLAITTLKETGQKNNALVILSDGEKHDDRLSEIIDEAKRSGMYIFAVGVGTDDGGFVPNKDFPGGRMVGPDGRTILSRLQPATMRRLASDTNGRYAIAAGGTDIPAMVKLATKDLDEFEMKGRDRQLVIEFYQWLVLPAVLFLMISICAGTRWRGINATAAIAFAFFATLQPAPAGEVADAAGHLAKGRHQEAQSAYSKLARETRLPGQAAGFSLGEATAAYRAGNLRAARAAYSRALLATDPAVASHAHFGLANTLFQIGWQSLAKAPYPADPKSAPDLTAFDAIVKERLNEMLKATPEGDEPTPGIKEFESTVLNWSDATAHYDSALAGDPANPDLTHNRDTTITYFKRLMELLQQEQQQTSESIPEPQPNPSPGNPGEEKGEGPGQQPDQQKNPENEGGDDKDPKDQGDKGGDSKEPPKDPGDKGDPKDNQGDKPDSKQKGDPKESDAPQPDETPEDAARRILGENADLQKGPPRAGRHIQRHPQKDW
jgi:Ca-activated chloride channel family protein